MGNWHLEILDENRRQLFSKLAAFKNVGYLAGGTALALQIGHRISYDFDIFCHKEISPHFASKVNAVFPIKEILINNQDELTFLTYDNIKVSFIYYPFDLNEYLIEDQRMPLRILSPFGVSLAKAYVLNRRNSWRDYLDLYVVVKSDLSSLGAIIKGAHKVYQELFNEKLFLAQLDYIADIPKEEIEGTQLLSNSISVNKVKSFFQNKIDKYLNLNPE